MSEKNAQAAAAYRKVIARAWADPKFKAQLLSDPKAALAAEGVVVPPEVSVKVVENTANMMHVVLPPPLTNDELSETELDKVAGGLLSSSFMLQHFWFIGCGGTSASQAKCNSFGDCTVY